MKKPLIRDIHKKLTMCQENLEFIKFFETKRKRRIWAKERKENRRLQKEAETKDYQRRLLKYHGDVFKALYQENVEHLSIGKESVFLSRVKRRCFTGEEMSIPIIHKISKEEN